MKIVARMSAVEISDAQRQANALHERIAGRRPGNKVAVEVGTLKTILRLIDAIAPFGVIKFPRVEELAYRARMLKQRRQALNNLTAFTEKYETSSRL